ncbi:MAG: ABC transporter ATP-binding protein [Rhodospirillaceae bacterium]|nr:ABC transporter ATP-binding protein [Rhodospirillaceae bacterium]MBL6929964.1 ABC transporter ATP-binding protein [Rhodospirillales bacterium]MBL6941607.1 ABC transporter ATP-binding protein [Rhodospirillales bacterium]
MSQTTNKLSPPSSIGLSVRGAHLAWHQQVLFDGLNLDLAAGRWTCLLGPSGIGKSMLLRLILGLDGGQGNSQTITCSDGLALDGRVAFMAQRDFLYPWLSVLDNVLLGCRIRNENAPDRDKALDLLSRTGLAAVATAMPDTLSGGMRQRAAIARTLMEDRPVVLMDEPFSALDAITKIRLQGLAAELLNDRTVLLVTHDPLEALRLGHAIHVMNGRPAVLGAAIEPKRLPPRPVDDVEVLEHQGELLRQLAEAAP